MRFLKAFMLAASLGAAALCAAPAALAQPSQAASVIVVDYDGIVARSDVGRSMTSQLQTIATTIQGELRPEAQAIETEERAIRTAVGDRTAEQVRGDSALARRIEALQRRSETFRQRQVTAARDLEYTRQQTFDDFNERITPIVREIMESRGAGVVISASAVHLAVPSADATDDVVSRLNQRVRTISVTRRTAPTQQSSGASQ